MAFVAMFRAQSRGNQRFAWCFQIEWKRWIAPNIIS